MNLLHFLSKLDKDAQDKIIAVVKKCKEEDKKAGKPWCIYKHSKKGGVKDPQPKGFPKHYETKEDAKHGLKMMKTFGASEDNTIYQPEQIKVGKEIEKEHTGTLLWLFNQLGVNTDSEIVKELITIIEEKIAKDHLREIEDYYLPWLVEMEKKAKEAADVTSSIETDTPIIPYAVAETVIEEVLTFLEKEKFSREEIDKFFNKRRLLADKLAKEAETIYKNNAKFKKDINVKGKGRDHLYMFMRHWLAAELKKEFELIYDVLPKRFLNGQKI